MAASYQGTTAASSVSNPAMDVTAQLGGGGNQTSPGNRIWIYNSTNTSTEFTAVNFFSDGYYLGMKPGDVVIGVYTSSAGSTTITPYLAAVGAVSTSGATLNSATS